ncbi:MAG: hypothetical protein IKS79_05145 [Bacteroidales bacterium]|nr:hypothetical protein [Bacteroidales bacterium]
MKKIVIALALIGAIMSCKSYNQAEPAVENTAEEISFETAKNYFFKNNQEIPANPKITDSLQFANLFGMATVMGENGKPTPIDFNSQFAVAVVLPVTDMSTEILPQTVVMQNDTLRYTYEVEVGDKQSFSIRPLSIIILDKKYESIPLVMNQK